MNKPCLTCNSVGPWGRSGRCDTHRKAVVNAYESNPERKTYKAQRYNNEYDKERRYWLAMMQIGIVNCPRCG